MKIPKQSPLKQIRRTCLHCVCGSTKSVRFCMDVDCPNWFLRFGKKPQTIIKENGQHYIKLFEKDNFRTGAIFGPEIREDLKKL